MTDVLVFESLWISLVTGLTSHDWMTVGLKRNDGDAGSYGSV
jgi:hypothetical protein